MGSRLQGPTTPTPSLINLLEGLTELQETGHFLDYWFIIKGHKSGTARWQRRPGRGPGKGGGAPVASGGRSPHGSTCPPAPHPLLPDPPGGFLAESCRMTSPASGDPFDSGPSLPAVWGRHRKFPHSSRAKLHLRGFPKSPLT